MWIKLKIQLAALTLSRLLDQMQILQVSEEVFLEAVDDVIELTEVESRVSEPLQTGSADISRMFGDLVAKVIFRENLSQFSAGLFLSQLGDAEIVQGPVGQPRLSGI